MHWGLGLQCKQGGKTYSAQHELTIQDLFESHDGILEVDVLALRAGEHLGHLEGLGEEPLHLTGTRHSQFVLLRQLVHTQDSDDVLQRLEILKDNNTVSCFCNQMAKTSVLLAVVWSPENTQGTVFLAQSQMSFSAERKNEHNPTHINGNNAKLHTRL